MDWICETCGNPIETPTENCPYCEQPISAPISAAAASQRHLRTVNLKSRLPTVDEALRHLEHSLDLARVDQIRVVKLIHGYGSTGTGGRIKVAVHRRLNDLESSGRIRAHIPGEDFARGSRMTAHWIRQFPRLKDDSDYNRRNPGITLVIL